MAVKRRYIEKEEELLRELKSTHPSNSWDTIAELYNAKVGDESRWRTGLGLQLKFKKIQAREKRLARKAGSKSGRWIVLPADEQISKNRTTPMPLSSAEALPREQRISQIRTPMMPIPLVVPSDSTEYEVSLLQVSGRRLRSCNGSNSSTSGISEPC